MPAQPETTQERGFGPFVTFVVRKRPDGVIAHWESRAHRKHLHGAAPIGSTMIGTFTRPAPSPLNPDPA